MEQFYLAKYGLFHLYLDQDDVACVEGEREMNNISTFWGFVLKVHSFASPESDTDIIRNVAVTGTSGRMHCGIIKEL